MCESIITDQSYWKQFLQQLKMDYNTPRFKAEVVFDTLLLPTIVEDLVSKAVCKKIQFVVKEFPIRSFRVNNGKDNNYTFCVDYLLYDDETMYFVELKTDKNSIGDKQIRKYMEIKSKYSFHTLYYDDYLNGIIKCYKKKYEKQKQTLKMFKKLFPEKISLVYIIPEKNKILENQDILCIVLEDALKNIDQYNVFTQEFLHIWEYVNEEKER